MNLEIFMAIILKTWIFASGIHYTKEIPQAPGAWGEILSSREHCLMYRAVLREQSGELAIFTKKPDGNCVESISSHPIAFHAVDETPKFSVKEDKVELSAKYNENIQKISFPLWGEKIPEVRNAYIGEEQSNNVKFLDPESVCSEEECRNCPRGFLIVTTANGIKRICHDPSLCGGRNQPACYLGQDWGGPKNSGCIDNSKSGWCQAGLATRCSSDLEYLVCE